MLYGHAAYSRAGTVEVGFASQKNFIGLYILRTDVMKAHKNLLKVKGVTFGKGCIRYSKPERIDFNVVERMLRATQETTGPVLLSRLAEFAIVVVNDPLGKSNGADGSMVVLVESLACSGNTSNSILITR